MSLIKIKFIKAGSWGDNPKDPIFDVYAGEVRLVSSDLANIAVSAGKATFMLPETSATPKAGPKKKAEGKAVKKKAEGKK